ncbi:MAG: hypothetical protein L6Q98_16540 [Anaerolineae bacterium]|nr:hypothetical protein [Anaerolineae bacterium]NUQ04387.1 hypothetical protein [Anaerolineae bacterium]
MRREDGMQRTLLNNALWFAGSLGLAFLVWLVAVVQSDPVEQRSLSERVPVNVTPNPALIITNQSEVLTSAVVTVRGPQSVITAMTADDIILSIDLTNHVAGTYSIPIEALIAPEKRASVVRITPRTLNIRLETRLTELKPVRVEMTSLPAAVYAVGEPQIDLLQVEVSGPESRVSRVTEVVARVALEDARAAFADDVTLVAVDADEQVISGVTLSQAAARVTVEVQQRADVAEVRVLPNIVGELPPGYVLTPDFSYTPQTVIVRGPQDVLSDLPGTFFTEPIDLSERTGSFEVIALVSLPDPRLLVLTGGSVTVRVGVAAQQVTRQFERVPITLIGVDPALLYALAPTEVTVLVTGPAPLLDDLDPHDLSALVDVGGMRAGESAHITPVASVGQDNAAVSASVLPAEIDVIARAAEATPEATETVGA